MMRNDRCGVTGHRATQMKRPPAKHDMYGSTYFRPTSNVPAMLVRTDELGKQWVGNQGFAEV